MSGWEEVLLPEIPRDRFKRPMIKPPGGGKEEPYTRATTWAGAVEDTYNLGRWQQRMTAHGLSIRPDLLLRVSSLGEEPPKFVLDPRQQTWETNPRYRPWVQSMDEACETAQEAAAAHAKATIGTSLHALAEIMDRGEEMPVVPSEYLSHLAAYAEATAGWEWLEIERFLVLDDLKIGGTPDRIAMVPGHPRPVIADIKTGDVTYGQGKMAMQLAIYAHSEIYHLDGIREPLHPDLDQEIGLIIALDAVKASCEILTIDIAAGWRGVQLAGQVRSWRSRRGFTGAWDPAAIREQPARPAAAPGWRVRLASASWRHQAKLDPDSNIMLITTIGRAESEEELVAIWQSVQPSAWDQVHTDHAARRKAQLAEAAA